LSCRKYREYRTSYRKQRIIEFGICDCSLSQNVGRQAVADGVNQAVWRRVARPEMTGRPVAGAPDAGQDRFVIGSRQVGTHWREGVGEKLGVIQGLDVRPSAHLSKNSNKRWTPENNRLLELVATGKPALEDRSSFGTNNGGN
jgi:hypothetical protein